MRCHSVHKARRPESHGLSLMQIAFLGLVTPIMHDFWNQKEGSEAQVSGRAPRTSQLEMLMHCCCSYMGLDHLADAVGKVLHFGETRHM